MANPGSERRGQAFEEVGVASWYGAECAMNFTSNGERYNFDALTAAHPTLPFGTKIKVTNLRNHQTVVLRVNDRGPFVRGRILDVSEAAAQRLGFKLSGLARVRIEVVLKSDSNPRLGAEIPGPKTLREDFTGSRSPAEILKATPSRTSSATLAH